MLSLHTIPITIMKTLCFILLSGLIWSLPVISQPASPVSRSNLSPAARLLVDDLQRNMVQVHGDSFQMGATTDREPEVDTRPVHTVYVHSFLISRYAVTQALWTAVQGHNPSGSTICDSCPVEKVSWTDARDFILKLNKLTGRNYRLPTEAEWEYAAKGGSKSKNYLFSGSDEMDSIGWNDNNSDKRSHPIGQKNPNELGLYDMTGNVLEWCSDWYKEDYYRESPVQNPPGPPSGNSKVLRGCAWNIFTSHCAVTVRAELPPDSHFYNVGFRLAADP